MMRFCSITTDSSLMRATVWRYIFPTLISFMSSAINGVIDAAIVGHLVGPSGLSVINMCMPIKTGLGGTGCQNLSWPKTPHSFC